MIEIKMMNVFKDFFFLIFILIYSFYDSLKYKGYICTIHDLFHLNEGDMYFLVEYHVLMRMIVQLVYIRFVLFKILMF